MNVNTRLNGTEKQVAWAEDIRREMLEGIDSYIQRAKANNPKADEYVKMMDEKVLGPLAKVEDAKWFIDHRNETNPQACIQLIYKTLN